MAKVVAALKIPNFSEHAKSRQLQQTLFNCLPGCGKLCRCIKCFGSNSACLPSDFMEVADHINYNETVSEGGCRSSVGSKEGMFGLFMHASSLWSGFNSECLWFIVFTFGTD